MVQTKDKIVTVGSLAVLHEDSQRTYMQKSNPVGDGTMTMNGNANISGSINVGSIMIGKNVKLVPTADSLEIIFLNEEMTEES